MVCIYLLFQKKSSNIDQVKCPQIQIFAKNRNVDKFEADVKIKVPMGLILGFDTCGITFLHIFSYLLKIVLILYILPGDINTFLN